MNISTEVFNRICELNTDQIEYIKTIFIAKIENVFMVGFELSDAHALGYSRYIRLIIKLLSCTNEEKEKVLKEINSVDLHYHYNYSSKSCFTKGFKQAKKEVENQIKRLKTVGLC